jgi:hypothetical protein
MRVFIGSILIRLGMWVLPVNVRQQVRSILLFHVPGALSDQEKSDLIAAKTAYNRSRQ